MDAVGFLFVGMGLAATHASLYRREQGKLEAWVPPGTAAMRGRALPGASGQRVEGLKFLGSRGGSEIRPQGPVPLSLFSATARVVVVRHGTPRGAARLPKPGHPP